MENKINIAEILRDMPKGTKLYSPLFGECNLDNVCTSDRKTYPITLLTSADTLVSFTKNGHYVDGFEDAECSLFPSAKMRCWDKFFKRGDIVYNPHSQMYAVFECWANDEQRTLFIAAAEKHYGGKYNPETLQVETVKVVEPKCSFKPFDKVLVRCNEDSVWRCELFSHYNTFNKQCPYVCLSSVYKYCIPYEGNQHLLGTTNNPR